jgi:hypothetical protein
MPVTSNTIANQAIQLMGDNQPAVTGLAPNFDTSTAGIALQNLYFPCVRTVARQFGWDYARNTAILVPSGNVAPFPYLFEYLYPPNGIQVRQVMPQGIPDINNPLPINWAVGNVIVGGNQVKVIWTNLPAAQVVWTNMPSESTWDPLFQEAVVRLLASELSIALASRLDTSRELMSSGQAFEQVGEGRDS